jgi:hypothetical protein
MSRFACLTVFCMMAPPADHGLAVNFQTASRPVVLFILTAGQGAQMQRFGVEALNEVEHAGA